MMKNNAIAVLMLTAASTASAESYQIEVSQQYNNGTIEVNRDIDYEAYAFTGSYYFSPVSEESGPYAESAFLTRASSISLDIISGEFEEGGDTADNDSSAVDIRMVSKESGWILGLGYKKTDIEDLGDFDIAQLTVGKYLSDSSAISIGIENIQVEDDSFLGSASINYENVIPGDVTYRIEADLGYTELLFEDESGVGIRLAVTAYPSRNIGIGVSYASNTVDFSNYGLTNFSLEEVDSYSARLFATWFVTERLHLDLDYQTGELESVDFDVFEVGLAYRF